MNIQQRDITPEQAAKKYINEQMVKKARELINALVESDILTAYKELRDGDISLAIVDLEGNICHGGPRAE